MFSPRSRYAKQPTETVRLEDGREVAMVRIPRRAAPPLAGWHRRLEGQRLDHVAAHHLGDPAGFWRLCDAAGTPAPEALAARAFIGIPVKEG